MSGFLRSWTFLGSSCDSHCAGKNEEKSLYPGVLQNEIKQVPLHADLGDLCLAHTK